MSGPEPEEGIAPNPEFVFADPRDGEPDPDAQPDDGNAEIGDGQPVTNLPPIEPEQVPGAEGLPDEVRDGMIDDEAPPDLADDLNGGEG